MVRVTGCECDLFLGWGYSFDLCFRQWTHFNREKAFGKEMQNRFKRSSEMIQKLFLGGVNILL